MVKAEASRRTIRVEAGGTAMEIAAEICVIINSIYNIIQEDGVKAAFKDYMQVCMGDDAPTWVAKISGGTAVYMAVPKKGDSADE